MVENGISIIAACLPALRQMLLGHTSQLGTSSYGRHYELSDARRMNQQRQGTGAGTVSQKQMSSEEELVKDLRSRGTGAASAASSSLEKGVSGSGIYVHTTVDVQNERGSGAY